jgi:hypothetical protein
MKYEIDNPMDCISKVTGENLCKLKMIYLGGIGVTFLLVIYTIVMKRRYRTREDKSRSNGKGE